MEVTTRSSFKQCPDSFLFDYQSLTGIAGRFAEYDKMLKKYFLFLRIWPCIRLLNILTAKGGHDRPLFDL
jgi:hypothetical protein